MIGLIMNPVFGQEGNSITITDTSYDYCNNNTIEISGTVNNFLNEIPITLRVVSPNNSIIAIDQVDVNEDKTFQTKLSLGLLREGGTYIIKVQYGQPSLSAETTFEYQQVLDGCGWGLLPTLPMMEVLGTELSVEYMIVGGQLLSITPDVDKKSLVLEINASDDGDIVIILPKSLIDNTEIKELDDAFSVFIDGEKVDYDYTTSSTHRTLTIPFQVGVEEIEIIGTFVIPEFGTITVMILAVAIISIIMVSTKSRFGIIYKGS